MIFAKKVLQIIFVVSAITCVIFGSRDGSIYETSESLIIKNQIQIARGLAAQTKEFEEDAERHDKYIQSLYDEYNKIMEEEFLDLSLEDF